MSEKQYPTDPQGRLDAGASSTLAPRVELCLARVTSAERYGFCGLTSGHVGRCLPLRMSNPPPPSLFEKGKRK